MVLICTLPTHLLAERGRAVRTSASGCRGTNPSQTSERAYVKQDDGELFCNEEFFSGKSARGLDESGRVGPPIERGE